MGSSLCMYGVFFFLLLKRHQLTAESASYKKLVVGTRLDASRERESCAAPLWRKTCKARTVGRRGEDILILLFSVIPDLSYDCYQEGAGARKGENNEYWDGKKWLRMYVRQYICQRVRQRKFLLTFPIPSGYL